MPCEKCLEKQSTRKTATPSTLGKLPKCRLCSKQLSNASANYCQDCSFQKGICCYCGVRIMDVRLFKQTGT